MLTKNPTRRFKVALARRRRCLASPYAGTKIDNVPKDTGAYLAYPLLPVCSVMSSAAGFTIDCRANREDPQAVTVTAAARSAATQRGLRGPVCRHRGSQHAARSADCGEELRGASAKRWRSVAECMHGAKERSQREALAECWRSQREALAEPAGSRWLRAGISAERLYSAARTVHPIPLHGARRI